MREARFHMAVVILGGLVPLIGALQVLNPRRKRLKIPLGYFPVILFRLRLAGSMRSIGKIIKLIGCVYQQVLNRLFILTNAVRAKYACNNTLDYNTRSPPDSLIQTLLCVSRSNRFGRIICGAARDGPSMPWHTGGVLLSRGRVAALLFQLYTQQYHGAIRGHDY
jgi:hypothetical protein